MWVCLCKGVSTATIRAAIAAGAASVKAIGDVCGAGTDCTRCQRHLKLLLHEQRELTRPPTAATTPTTTATAPADTALAASGAPAAPTIHEEHP